MPENPLLPDAELRALLALTRRVIALEARSAARLAESARRAPNSSAPAREAALAAAALQLKPGDLWVPEATDTALLALFPAPSETAPQPLEVLPSACTLGASRLLLTSALASGLRTLQTGGVVLAFTRAGQKDPGWLQALSWAQEKLLPLILVCLDASGDAAFTPKRSSAAGRFDWTGVAQATNRLKLPVLTVDGEDAVAMYRTTQEAVLRARAGGGPAILWAALATPAEADARPASHRPLVRLTRYMRARKIALS